VSEAEVLQFIMPLLDGVEEVHRHGLLHRDIKPENILIRRDGTPVLLDFGAARRALGERSRKFTTILTEGYAPFEQYAGTEHQGASSDVYALAAVMFHALSGRSPVGAPQRATAKLSGNPDPLAKDLAALRPRISSDIAFAIEAGLRVVDKERPQTVAEFRELLVSALPSTVPVPSVAATHSVITLVPDLATRGEAPRFPPPWRAAPLRRPRRARRAMVFAATMLAAIGAAFSLGDPLDWLPEVAQRNGIESAEKAAAPRTSKPENMVGQSPEVDERRGADDPDLEQRRDKALLEYQQRQLDWLEEERRQIQAAIRAAEAERQRAAEAEAKKRTDTSGPSVSPPADTARPTPFPNPFTALRAW
jgi:serine/threonine protein kinase